MAIKFNSPSSFWYPRIFILLSKVFYSGYVFCYRMGKGKQFAQCYPRFSIQVVYFAIGWGRVNNIYSGTQDFSFCYPRFFILVPKFFYSGTQGLYSGCNI